jgi:hypothetical protein
MIKYTIGLPLDRPEKKLLLAGKRLLGELVPKPGWFLKVVQKKVKKYKKD